MAELLVRVAGKAAPPLTKRRVTLKYGNELLTLPITNPENEIDGIAAARAQLSRPGQKPLSRRTEDTLKVLKLDVLLVGGVAGIEKGLRTLDRFANVDGPLVLNGLGSYEIGLYDLTSVKIRPKKRAYLTNAILRAEATLVLTEHVNDGFDRPPPAAPRPGGKPTKPGAAPRPRSYVVQRGDTLSKIAAKFYGDGDLWPKIAAANKISNPKTIKAGQRLVIP